MKLNWIIISIISSLIGGVITYILTENLKISTISAVIVLLIVIINNPNRRYIRGFYIVIFPLLSNIYFEISSKTENFDIIAGIKEIDITTTIILGLIAAICLILDYLERGGKLGKATISISKNKVGNITGNKNQINQNGV